NAPASLAGLEYKLRGPNVTISQKEASGLAAIVTAADAIRLGRSRMIAAGGVDAIFDIFFRVHDRFGVMSPAAPERVKGPFDRDRAGFVLGEGG
ncbi:beta-ketoacyl synthase N-terminal-like domain-containing protein, partial [Klebsiella pneumoniae]|uniref:beta-ketoacyl synthase N-terminal-like domain-containing protein n=1 Tax=Klebsiella pneumoniae TaxID=573 RepID=UPI00272ECB9E